MSDWDPLREKRREQLATRAIAHSLAALVALKLRENL